jgi:hypothetical protein
MRNGSLYRGYSGLSVTLSAHSPLAPRLKKRYSYTSASPLCLLGVQKDSLVYLYQVMVIDVYKHVVVTNGVCEIDSVRFGVLGAGTMKISISGVLRRVV